MYPQTHFAFGLLFIVILGIFTTLSPLALFIILASSILIDVDHWMIYVKEKKDLSIKKAYRWLVDAEKAKLSGMTGTRSVPNHNADKHKRQGRKFLCIFHTIEFFILMFIFSFFSQIIFYITVGCSFHFFLDLVYTYIYMGESRKPVSIIGSFLASK